MSLMRKFARGERARRRKPFFRATLPFLVVIGIQAVLATVSLNALSFVRAYVGGESLWTKGQKDAIYYLSLYAYSRDGAYFSKFRDALAIPLGDRTARRAMEQSPPDYAAATAGFLAGGNDPADVPGLILLFVHARGISYLADAVEQWRATDAILDDFAEVGEATRRDVEEGLRGGAGSMLARIEDLNERM